MSLTELAPQKSKEYNDHNIRKQDHGTAAEQKALRQSPYGEERRESTRKKAEAEHLNLHLSEADYALLTDTQRDTIADTLLDDEPDWANELVYSSEGHMVEDDSYIDPADLYYPTEAELGLKTRHEIGKEMARRVTLDVAYDEDDRGDSDYSVPVHINNRP